jgi:hypothetical protein
LRRATTHAFCFVSNSLVWRCTIYAIQKATLTNQQAEKLILGHWVPLLSLVMCILCVKAITLAIVLQLLIGLELEVLFSHNAVQEYFIFINRLIFTPFCDKRTITTCIYLVILILYFQNMHKKCMVRLQLLTWWIWI